MNQDQVKEILLQIEESELEFSVTFTGKASKKVNGLYKSDTHEILLHNKNFSVDNELLYTAIHEYTHHRHPFRPCTYAAVLELFSPAAAKGGGEGAV